MRRLTLPVRKATGFSLVEMAIVLAIVALLLGGLLPVISGQIERQKTKETQATLAEIKDALIGFAIANGNLPCPAKSASDGTEDRNTGTGACNTRQGFIPWVTLGVSKLDAWNRIFHYSATLTYTNSSSKFTLGAPRDITIKTRDAADALINLSNSNDIPAVILSHGANGYGATLNDGTAFGGTSATNTDEQTNYNASGTTFVSKDQSTRTTGSGEFDDLVVWISPNVLFSKMVAAGKLP